MKRKAAASLAVLVAAGTGMLVPHLVSAQTGEGASSPDTAKQTWSISAERIHFSEDRHTLNCLGQVHIRGPQQQRIQCQEAIVTFTEGNKFRTGSMAIEAQGMTVAVLVPQERVLTEATKTISQTLKGGGTATYQVPPPSKQP